MAVTRWTMGKGPVFHWTAFANRWNANPERDEHLFARFNASYDAFAGARSGPPWLMVLLAIGLIAFGTALIFGAVRVYDDHRWMLLYPLLKAGKWLVGGVAIVVAFVIHTCWRRNKVE